MKEDIIQAWKHISSIQLFQDHFEVLRASCERMKARSLVEFKRKITKSKYASNFRDFEKVWGFIPYSLLYNGEKVEVKRCEEFELFFSNYLEGGSSKLKDKIQKIGKAKKGSRSSNENHVHFSVDLTATVNDLVNEFRKKVSVYKSKNELYKKKTRSSNPIKEYLACNLFRSKGRQFSSLSTLLPEELITSTVNTKNQNYAHSEFKALKYQYSKCKKLCQEGCRKERGSCPSIFSLS